MKHLWAAVFVLVSLSYTPIHAADVTVGFIATIDYVEDGVCICLDHDALMGLEIYGYYTYDNATLDSDPAVGDGRYIHSTSPYGIRVYVGDDVFATNTANVNFRVAVQDAPAGGVVDMLTTTSYNNLADPLYFLPNIPTEWIGVWLDGGQDVIASEALPIGPPHLADWPNARVLILGPDYEYTIYASLTWIGAGLPVGVGIPVHAPSLLSLGPNPFSAQTTLRFRVSAPGPTTLRIYDVAGRLVRALDARSAESGREYDILWNARDESGHAVPSGVYFAELVSSDGRVTQKMQLLK